VSQGFLTDSEVLMECDLEALSTLVGELESRWAIDLVREPSSCLVMLRAADSVDGQQFFLGEALATECEVSIGGNPGLGICLGDDPVRAYCLAVADAAGLEPFATLLDSERARLTAGRDREARLIGSTRVDFKLMEQE
jgi:alpha-D-ribose 1-methylphosphonate 5-triphosphate synthase subunit PhnG